MTTNTSGFSLSKSTKKLIIWAAIIVGLLIIVLTAFGMVNTTHNEGVQKTSALEAQYLDNQNELSTYIVSFNEALGIADRQSEKVNEILLDAVKGRYDDDSSLQVGGQGAMFSAISEAYPDLTATSETYMIVQKHVIDGRNEYKNKQSKLLDMVRDFETWLDTDLMKRQVINFLDFPGDYLSVETAKGTVTGDEALKAIKSIVLSSEAKEAYETGTLEPLITPND